MITLGQLKKTSITSIAGCAPESAEFVQYLNDAVRQLINTGDWWATVQTMVGCVYDDRIVWPCAIDSVLSVGVNKEPVAIQNFWYQFVPTATHCPTVPVLEFDGTTPVFRLSTESNGILLFKASNLADIGKTVTVYYNDENNSPNLAVLTLTDAGVHSPAMSSLTAIVKDITVGNVSAYWFLPGSGIVNLAGIYRPNTTSAEFLYSLLRGGVLPDSTHPQQIKAIVKRGYEPMVLDTDICLIDNEDALRDMVQAIKRREAGAMDDSGAFELNAIRRLNHQLRNRFPNQQTVISLNATMTDRQLVNPN